MMTAILLVPGLAYAQTGSLLACNRTYGVSTLNDNFWTATQLVSPCY